VVGQEEPDRSLVGRIRDRPVGRKLSQRFVQVAARGADIGLRLETPHVGGQIVPDVFG
jgi:hypothetical protein